MADRWVKVSDEIVVPYVFQEYPKALYGAEIDGKRDYKEAHDADEEAVFREQGYKDLAEWVAPEKPVKAAKVKA